MFYSRIASGVIVNQALELENYDPNLLAFTYGLIPPVETTFSLTIKLTYCSFDPEVEELDREAEIEQFNLKLSSYQYAETYQPSRGNINPFILTLTSEFNGVHAPPNSGSFEKVINYTFNSALLVSLSGNINLNISPELRLQGLTSLFNGRINSNIKLTFSSYSRYVGGRLNFEIKLLTSLTTIETILATMRLNIPIHYYSLAVTPYISEDNSLLINLTNFAVSECSLNGVLANLDEIMLFSSDGIYVKSGISTLSASFEIENLEPRRAGRWTDIYFIGDGDFEVLVNDYECPKYGTLRDFTHRYRIPLGLRDRQFSFSINGQVEYIDLVKIDKVKGNWQ